ncbi:exosortase/archaeosortase family protein [Candidatus Daviesbacteria bacterium]|nr:exosortase/archaeosortase family protein [Candidatus Daviesbacteria bacterium]
MPFNQKQTFVYIFLILVIVLILVPITTVFNDLLTRIVINLDLYKYIQNVIIPWEIRLIGVILYPFGFNPTVVGEYLAIGKGNPLLVEVAWNCIGWQSLLFFIFTGWIGLQGDKYTLVSKTKAWIIGFLGTFLINLFRITLVVLIASYFGQNVGNIIHDHGSIIVIIAWLFFFWWFVYSFVLEEKKNHLIDASNYGC